MSATATQRELRPAIQSDMPIGEATASVIIPTLNEEKVIGQCLKSLARQRLPREAFEVIIVDNGSTDRTIEIARSFSDQLDVVALERRGCYASALRNLGASEARGRLLAFLDADCIAPMDWLTDAVHILGRGESRVIGAYYANPEDSSWVARAWCGDEWRVKHGEISYIPAGDLLIARSDFSTLGGFDESLETNEDYEFCRRAAASGMAVVAVPRIAVVHLGTPQTIRDFYRKQRWHGRHVLRVFLRNVSQFPNARAVSFAVFTLTCLAGAAVGLIWAFLSGPALPSIAFALALLAVGLLLAIRTAATRSAWRDIPALTLLFLTYGLARAFCLIDFRPRKAAS